MKQIILISLFITLGFGLQAQVAYSPEAPSISDYSNTLDIKTDIEITNELDESQDTYWYIDRVTPTDHMAPAEWEFYVCDHNLCYLPSTTACPPGNPSVFTANESWVYNFHMKPNGVEGIGDVILHITSEDGTILQSIPFHYDIQGPSSIGDLDEKQIKIYPNPTSDFIQIANDSDVAKLAIFNIVGKNINTSTHFEGKSHDVSTLQKGIYLVRLIDAKDKVLSVFRLNKN